MPSLSPEYSPFALSPDPAGVPGFIPVGRLPLYLTGCGDRPGQLVRVRGAAIRAFVAEVMEPDPDFVGERVRQPVEDGHRLTPGRGGRLAVTFGQQRVTQAGQRVALAELGGDIAVGLDGPGVVGFGLGGVAQPQ